MVHLDLYDEPIEPASGESFRSKLPRGVAPICRPPAVRFSSAGKARRHIAHPGYGTSEATPPAAVSARRQPGLGGDFGTRINRGEVAPLRIFDPDRDLRRVLPFNPQEQGKIMQPCVAPFHDNFHASLFVFDQLLIAGTKQYER
ncbi:MAG: hypothetical protein ACLRQT_05715 [Alistipes sp.]